MSVLDKIQKPNDVKQLTKDELAVLPDEIRAFLITHIAKTGGHLASNLGTVELTIALHLCLTLPRDTIVWDVGHQSYTHKILTGRRDGFEHLRQYGGMSGFPKRAESDCDAFDTGHSSTSLAAGLGFAWAREMNGQSSADETIVSVIGDGAMTGGLAWEALNSASALKKNFIIVLNDNEMSINENVGALAVQLSKIRMSNNYMGMKEGVLDMLEKFPNYGERIANSIRRTKSGIKQLMVPGMVFEQMGIVYFGPVDGHNVQAMVDVLTQAKKVQGPVIVHVLTKKGKGYEPAERHPARFHGTDAFDIAQHGLPKKQKNPGYTDIFSTVMRKMGDRNPRVVAITAAMTDGVGLKRFRNMFPNRFFDVGIAEDYAVTFAAALSLRGLTPVFAVYSSFLQRAYDEILHDVCLQNLHVIFAIDRAGLVGADGETHQGVFDLSYLSMMPNMTVLAPKNIWELSDMMKFAVDFDAPIAVRYPRGEAYGGLREFRDEILLGKAEVIYDAAEDETAASAADCNGVEISGARQPHILLFALGSMVKIAEDVYAKLTGQGIAATLVNARFAKPFDREYLATNCARFDIIVTMEENVKTGGFGEQVAEFLHTECKDKFAGKTLNISVPDAFVPHGNVDVLLRTLKTDAESVTKRITEMMGER